ncbi:TMV resistance protein N-like [Alnus glutinosa]|uniref:TMV resistance protein N-like n=1 Tax=Alnus glutinosa TaxID=3517 RepID=UPI002D775238|nr:TMV resistance protein N-like [Alnus glutinosa]
MAFQGVSSSSSSTGGWTYEVFLSFRGEDTRHSFIAHLHKALFHKGITTFIDDEQLRSGEEISPALLRAIEESRISVVVFSETYASSRWCLDELLKIVECKETKGQIVVPVFYKVDPSDVRHQKKSYEKALAKLEERFKDDIKLQRWKAALTQVANLSGWDSEKYRNEAKFIDNIVQNVSRIVNHTYLHVAKHPVGIESCIQQINSLLSIDEMNDRRMVGIWGAGGIGKTTIAKAIYNSIAPRFEGSCFLADVTETSKKSGLVQLQNTLLSDILGDIGEVNNAYQGIAVIKRRLCSKRILLILDDVDHKLDQLDQLAGEVDWFGSGSRIIVTTRDRKVLTDHGVVDDLIYEVKELKFEEALELFRWNAFRDDKPIDNFLKLMEDAISYVGGLPLALVVLGSDLYRKNISRWKSALNKYKSIPPKDILRRLRISYDGLDENEKVIFLDIACFFIGEHDDDIKKLDSSDYSSVDGIGVLIERSLITIDHHEIEMHNLLRDMGREIVRLESPEDPNKRSRLWFHEDVRRVLEKNTGTNKIQGILVDFPEGDKVHLSSEAFKNMEMLRVLMVKSKTHLTRGCVPPEPTLCFSRGGPTFLPDELRMLDWPDCPMKSFPSNFQGKKLVILRMWRSALKSFKGVKNFRSLTIMDFDECEFLEMIPDVSNIPNLEKLTLRCCTNLVEIHQSVGFLDQLVNLNLNYCYNLKSFPRRLRLRSLEYLGLGGCSKLNYFPEIECEMEHLRCIYLEYSGIKELPSSIRHAISLRDLYLEKSINLTNLPSSIYQLEHLVRLTLGGCSKLVKFPEKMGDNKQSMPSTESEKESEISTCLELPPLPPLTNASVSNDGCSSVVFPALENLSMKNCVLLESNFFKIFNCSSTLEDLDLSGSDIVTIPAGIKRFVRLRRLNLDNCEKLREISELPPNIQNVYATRCMSLETFLEEPQISRSFNTWSIRELVRVESVSSAPSPVGNGIEPMGSSVNNITPDREAHIGVDDSITPYQDLRTRRTLLRFQPLMESLDLDPNRGFNASISGNKIPHWFSYHKEVSNSNSDKCEIDIDVPAYVDGVLGIAFAAAVVGTDNLVLSVGVINRGVVIYKAWGEFYKRDANHVFMHFVVPVSFMHFLGNDHLRAQFYWLEASNSRFFKSFGFHMICRYKEKIDLIDYIRVTKRPCVDDGDLESEWYQHQKPWAVDFQMQRACDLVNRNYTNTSVIISVRDEKENGVGCAIRVKEEKDTA